MYTTAIQDCGVCNFQFLGNFASHMMVDT